MLKLVLTSETTGRENQLFLAFHSDTFKRLNGMGIEGLIMYNKRTLLKSGLSTWWDFSLKIGDRLKGKGFFWGVEEAVLEKNF